jgi:hypothetical protein
MKSRGGIELRKRPGEGYIAFVGNYLPRQCGIATFTTDLCESVAEEAAGADCIAVAMNDVAEGYPTPIASASRSPRTASRTTGTPPTS